MWMKSPSDQRGGGWSKPDTCWWGYKKKFVSNGWKMLDQSNKFTIFINNSSVIVIWWRFYQHLQNIHKFEYNSLSYNNKHIYVQIYKFCQDFIMWAVSVHPSVCAHCGLLAQYQLHKSSDVLQNDTVNAFWECLGQVLRSMTVTYFWPTFQGQIGHWKAY